MSNEPDPFVDDRAGIPDDTVLYRRITWNFLGGREKYPPGAEARLNGNCFRDYKEEKARALGYPGACMSVGAHTVFQQLGIDPKVMISGPYEGYGLAAVTAQDLRNLVRSNGMACPQGVMLRPTEEEPWHAVVFDLGGGERRPPVCNAICDKARWVVPLINEYPTA
jgi:hypothetical protein